MDTFSHIELDEKQLAKETLQYILKIQDTYLECILYQLILDPRVKYGDLYKHVDLLEERLSHLKFSVDLTDVYFENLIPGYTQYKYDEDGSKVDDSWVLTELRYKIENLSKDIFWANKKEDDTYRIISNFYSFEEKLVPQAKLYKTLINATFFNTDNWIQYYQDLLDLKFPEFSNKLVSGKKIIKYRPFKGDFYLGIETDYQFCRNRFRKGKWEEPDYKLIIFERKNEKKPHTIVLFEKFIHPFFYTPIFSFEKFRYVENTIKVSELEFSCKYIVEKEFLEDGTVKLSMSEEFGEHLKRHAYFYYDMLYHTTKEYIKFIEASFELENE